MSLKIMLIFLAIYDLKIISLNEILLSITIAIKMVAPLNFSLLRKAAFRFHCRSPHSPLSHIPIHFSSIFCDFSAPFFPHFHIVMSRFGFSATFAFIFTMLSLIHYEKLVSGANDACLVEVVELWFEGQGGLKDKVTQIICLNDKEYCN